jgi:hypothetical protein
MRRTSSSAISALLFGLTLAPGLGGCGGKAASDTTAGEGGDSTSTSGADDDANDDDDDDDAADPASASASMSSTNASMTSNDDGDDDDGDPSGGFIGEADNGVVEAQCDPGMQDCPRGQKCTSYVSTPGGKTVDATHCVDIMGDVQFGEVCERIEGNDDCAAGLFCMTDVSGHTGMGVCLEFCVVGEPCEYGGECLAFNDGTLPLCEEFCDPLLQDCPGEQGCYAAFNTFVCAMPGPVEGMGQDGATCATIQGCNPGLICRTGTDGCPSDSGCCTPICDLSGDPDQCAQPESCIGALDDPPPSLQDVGFCGIPE